MKRVQPTLMSQLLCIRGKLEKAAQKQRKAFIVCDPNVLIPAVDHYSKQSYWLKTQKLYTKAKRSYKRTVYMCPCCATETIQPQNYCGHCGALLQIYKKTK